MFPARLIYTTTLGLRVKTLLSKQCKDSDLWNVSHFASLKPQTQKSTYFIVIWCVRPTEMNCIIGKVENIISGFRTFEKENLKNKNISWICIYAPELAVVKSCFIAIPIFWDLIFWGLILICFPLKKMWLVFPMQQSLLY